MNDEIHCIRLFNIYGATGGNYAGNVYDIDGIAPALNDMRGGNRQPLIETKKIIVGGAEDHLKIRNANLKGYEEAYEGDSVNLTYPSSTTRRGRVGHKVAQTIQSSDTQGVVIKGNKALQKTLENTILIEGEPQALDLYNHKGQELAPALKDPIHNDRRLYDGLRIRKLTPKECWRLMGFADEDFEKARKVNSDTQLYKQAGNSIVVDVLVAIFRNLLTSEYEEPKEQQMKWF